MYKYYRLVALVTGICVGLGFLPVSGAATTRYVSQDGGHDVGGGFADWSGAATNIQAAVDVSDDGDTILVSNGTYTASDGTTVVRIEKSLDIQGVCGRDATFISGENERRGLAIWPSTSGDPVRLSGFTIINGMRTGDDGGGIYINSVRDVYISACTISNNTARNGGGVFRRSGRAGALTISDCSILTNTATVYYGGGIYAASDGKLTLLRCLIANNVSEYCGGGLALHENTPLQMDACRVLANYAKTSGGGLYLRSGWLAGGSATAVVNQCTISDNSVGTAAAGTGGGIYVRDFTSDTFISNCVISGNVSPYARDACGSGVYFAGEGSIYGCLIVSNKAVTYGAGLTLDKKFVRCENLTIAHNDSDVSFGGEFFARADATAEVFNSIIYDNSKGNIGFAPGGGQVVTFNNVCTTPLSQLSTSSGTNNFDAGPLFVGWDGEKYDYRLRPNSPCINAGTNLPGMLNAVDLDGNARIDRFSGQVDIGCYEDVPKGTLFLIR